jgi:hypothetical protein
MNTQQMLQQLLAKMEANHKEMMAKTDAETEAMRDKRMEANRDDRKERTSCHEATETEPDPGMMQSIDEHQEMTKEDAAVMPVGEPRKWRRVRNLAAQRARK